MSPIWMDLDTDAFVAALGRHALPFRHRLAGHPRLRPEAIAHLAGGMPPLWMNPQPGRVPLLVPEGLPSSGADRGEVARTIHDNGYRLTLRLLERVDSYRELLHGCLDQVAAVVSAHEGGMGHRDASVFLGSPGAVVPAHFDRHHNLLLQVAGSKDLTVGVFPDPAVERRQIERNFESRQRLAGELPSAQHTFHLEAGDALYIPPYAFHWVEGGSDVSVALSCAFSTPRTERAELVHACNVRLRRLGLPARPPGRSQHRDRAKAAIMIRARRVRRSRLSRRSG